MNLYGFFCSGAERRRLRQLGDYLGDDVLQLRSNRSPQLNRIDLLTDAIFQRL